MLVLSAGLLFLPPPIWVSQYIFPQIDNTNTFFMSWYTRHCISHFSKQSSLLYNFTPSYRKRLKLFPFVRILLSFFPVWNRQRGVCHIIACAYNVYRGSSAAAASSRITVTCGCSWKIDTGNSIVTGSMNAFFAVSAFSFPLSRNIIFFADIIVFGPIVI